MIAVDVPTFLIVIKRLGPLFPNCFQTLFTRTLNTSGNIGLQEHRTVGTGL